MISSAGKAESSVKLYSRLLQYLKPLIPVFVVCIIGFAIHATAGAWFFELIGQLIDSIEAGAEVAARERMRIPLTLVALVAMRGLGGFFGSYCLDYVAFKVIHKLRCQLMDKFLCLPIPFYDKNTAGHLLSTVTFNVTQITAAVSNALKVILQEGGFIIAVLILLLSINWKLTLIFLSITPVISLVVVYASTKFRKHSSRIQSSMGDVTQILSETMKGLKVVRTFNGAEQVNNKFTTASSLNTKQNLKMAFIASLSAPIIQVLVAIALAFLVWLTMAPATLNNMTPGDFTAFITAAGSLLKPIRQISKINAEIQRGLAAAQSIFELLDEEQEHDTGTEVITRAEGRISFNKVSFRYAGDTTDVIENVSFSCEPGQTIAIVGQSGSGKSTLVNLLPRFYELNSGEILLDGTPHSSYTLHSLRQQIALVSQQVVLFNGTIKENIAYGDLAEASDEDIIAALTKANAMEFINGMEEGINTLVGDDGLLLSGGQRQRLAIARALLKNAPVLILDEATSALDTASERYIQSALEQLMQGRTTFVIAHRLSTVENADQILVMSKGKIVESGTHQALLAMGKEYAKLHSMQFADDSNTQNIETNDFKDTPS